MGSSPTGVSGKEEPVEYRVLGSLEVRSDGEAPALGPPKQRAVLAILLLHAGEIVPTDRLVELVSQDGLGNE